MLDFAIDLGGLLEAARPRAAVFTGRGRPVSIWTHSTGRGRPVSIWTHSTGRGRPVSIWTHSTR